MAKASDNPFPSLLLVEQASAPATPAAGQARLYRGTDNKLYIVDDAGTATEVGAGGGGGGGAGEVLAFKQATASALYTTSSGTDADVDATNLAITFTVPTSGKVLVELSGILEVTSGSPGQWSIRSGSSTVQSCLMGTGYARRVGHFYVSGLTPGTSVTYKWGHSRVGSTGAINLYTGGNAGTSGNAMMRVIAMP